MSGCIGPATLSNSTTDTDEPVFKNFPTKANTTPVVIQFLNYPSNAELLSAYLSEKSNHNEQNIAWIISESQDKYILKMQVDGKEFTGYLPK